MSAPALFVLSPYRMPAQNTQFIGNDEAAAFLNAYIALWHPAALLGTSSPPQIVSAYDYEEPQSNHVYALPESPPLILPDDWESRAASAKAGSFKADGDRASTLGRLTESLGRWAGNSTERTTLVKLDQARVAPFLSLGFGYLMVDTLFEAMQHEKLLNTAEFWDEIQKAILALTDPDPEAYRKSLQAAAELLLAAREVLYPVTIHLVDMHLTDGARPESGCPDLPQPINVIAAASLIEKLSETNPEVMTRLRSKCGEELIEICGGSYLEREDALLSVESQIWNLNKGQQVYKRLLDAEVKVFARRRFAFHPHLPMFLQFVGIQRTILLTFDDGVLPSHRATVINWPSPDGKQVEAFTRKPHEGDNPQTYFHLAYYLHQSIMQDHAATIALLHKEPSFSPFYHDWMELSRLAPVLGKWTTLTKYFNEVLAGEYASAAPGDDLHSDYLTERTTGKDPTPISGFARHLRLRRELDTAWTLHALNHSLRAPESTSQGEASAMAQRLTSLEDDVESIFGGILGRHTVNPQDAKLLAAVKEIGQETVQQLGNRLLAKAGPGGPGFLVLNPCSFTRRVALELTDVKTAMPITGPIKACQIDEAGARLVVEVPPLGFAWFPQSGPPGTVPQTLRMRLADQTIVRNEFFEAEVDPATGGLRGIRDHRTRVNRIAQQLIFQPGSTMHAKEVKVTSRGPALGEIVSEGSLQDEHGRVLANFRQRYRAWLGRPLLEMRIEIFPTQAPEGYPWHAYYGARFAWRDERSVLVRGINGLANATTHTRPVTSEYLEWRKGKQNTILFPGGLPFHQRHGARMVDVILVTESETETCFDLALGLDRDYPAQTALGLVSPVPVMATPKGPPHVGTTGWLFHLDAPSLLLFNLRPDPDHSDAIVARVLESANHAVQAGLRCIRDPHRATLIDARGNSLNACSWSGDSVSFEMLAGDLGQLRIEFSEG